MIHILDVLSFFIAIAYTVVLFFTVSVFIPSRKNLFVKILALLPLHYIASAVIYANDLVNISVVWLCFGGYIFVFHRGEWVKKVSAVLIFYPALIAVNYIQQNLFSELFFAESHASGSSENWTVETLLFSTFIWTVSQTARLLFWYIALRFLRKYKGTHTSGKIKKSTWLLVDALLLISSVAVYTIISFIPEEHFVIYLLCAAAVAACFGGILLVAYISRLEQIAGEAERLKMQHEYYLEKQKEEERVRRVYHDMKNHLLVLEQQGNTAESVQAAGKLLRQIEEYEDYIHTGNDILDIILKEKSHEMREKQIDFSVTADLSRSEFLETLDISTMFGNGLDNAIEASEKLPEDQRAVLLKAGKVQNFVSIVIENKCLEEAAVRKGRTTKKDRLFHGLGIYNMKKAAGKYGGQLNMDCADGKFVLKILIPIPAA
ncbi:MAG: GHKL domain-containing protein [Eubacterium sp.]|nr:GHKL domain-containing protein [Eubacterium sp.]